MYPTNYNCNTSYSIKQVSLELLEKATEASKENKAKGNFLDLFRLPRLRCITLNIFFNWYIFLFSHQISE